MYICLIKGLFFTIFSESSPVNLIIGLIISYYISKFAENYAADKVSYSWPSIYYHIFGIAMVSTRNRVFSEHINILRTFTKSPNVISKSSISKR